jgi:alpha-L-fucosidase 2
LIFFGGNTERETIVVNEVTLWTGDDNPSQQYGGPGFGDYQTLGNLTIDLPDHKDHSQYKRALDIGDAVATVEYESHGVQYKREVFASHPSEVMVVRLTANKGGSYTGRIELEDSHKTGLQAADNSISADGKLQNGLRFAWKVSAHNTGGNLKVNGAVIEFNGCDSLTLIVSAGTDYVFDDSKKFKSGEDPLNHVNDWISKAGAKSYDALKTEHLNDFHGLFNRVDLDLGQSSGQQQGLPTNKRKVAAVTQFDPDFEEMFYQFGRYLMISSARTSLPPNLQVSLKCA